MTSPFRRKMNRPKLLVSVQSEREVPEAVEGGADIVDAKDPRRGTLGAVATRIIPEIVRRAGIRPVSVAIGEMVVGESPTQFESLVSAVAASGVSYVKIGIMPGVSPVEQARALTAVHRSAGNRVRTIVAVYAEYLDVMHLENLFRTARAQGVDGILLDTAIKDGRRLPDIVTWPEVRSWVRTVHAHGFRAVIAGSLRQTDMRQACETR